MLYIIILFVILILFNFFLNYREKFQTQPLVINTLEKKEYYTLFNINQLVNFNKPSINGYVMNGINSYIKLNTDKYNTLFTISLLFNTKNANKNQIILDSNILNVGINNKKLYFKYDNNLINHETDLISNFTYHLSIVYNKQEIIFYLNGIEKKILLNEINLDNILFGISKELENSFFGILGDIKIFNDSLSKEELCIMYNKCITETLSEDDKIEQQQSVENYKKMLNEFNKVNNKCEFNPFGKTLLACKDRCSSKDRTKWGGDSCTVEKCEEICKECDDVELCRWKKETKEYLDFLNKPKAIFIKGFPLDGKIKITWITATVTDITDYYLSISEMSKPVLRINFVAKSDNGLNEFTIINLKNNMTYEISLYSRNKYGISPSSNILRLTPQENKQESKKTIVELSDNDISSVYKANGNIEPTDSISNNEYTNVLDFIQAQKADSSEFNLDINFK